MTTERIIELCCKKDPKAQRALFEQFSGKVMTVCRRYANSKEEARELSQECFYQVLTCIDKYNSAKGEFEAWLYKLCYYTILGQKKKHIKFYELHPSQMEEMEESTNNYPVSGDEVIAEIQKLPEGYRMVLNLYIFEGLTHDEISDVLGISPSTSRSQLTRARTLLKKRLVNQNPHHYVSRSI